MGVEEDGKVPLDMDEKHNTTTSRKKTSRKDAIQGLNTLISYLQSIEIDEEQYKLLKKLVLKKKKISVGGKQTTIVYYFQVKKN